MYIGTLTLVLVLAVFGAVLLAMMLGNQLARPLLLLAEGVREVASGDLTRKRVFASRDELGGLTRSFAEMTDQLSEARELAERSLAQLERARTRLQTILDNLSAGVIVFDRHGLIEMVNPGATRILKLPLSAYVGRALSEVPGLEAFAQAVEQRFDECGPRRRRARRMAGGVRPADARCSGPRARRPRVAGARRRAAAAGAPDGVRRHHRGRVGAAQRRLERSRAPARARDQEPAHADPAVGRALAAPARGASSKATTRRCSRARWRRSSRRCRR